jgi:formylglycine-generating enzyme required for sulfatase activity
MQIPPQHVVMRVLLFLTVIVVASESLGQQKSPVPDGKTLETGQQAAREIYGARFQQAKTSAQKLALAKEMLDTAAKMPDGSADQYALLRIAGDIAAGAGEAPTALLAAERLAARFDVPAATVKAEALLAAAPRASTSSQQKAMAEAAAKIVDELATADEYEKARALCEVARGCARTGRQNTLLKDLTSRAEAIKQRAAAFQEYRAALAVLETSPKDAAANLSAGRYLCVVKGDWDRGLAMLGLGSDAELQTLALKDVQGSTSVQDEVALGDAWWSLADSKTGPEKDALRLRAGAWYNQAKPQLAAGLLQVKVVKRLEELSKLGVELPKLSLRRSSPGTPPLAVAPFDETTAKRHQAAWAQHMKVPVEMTNSIGMRFVLIPPGEFDMGSSDAEVAKLHEQAEATKQPQWYIGVLSAEAPKHRVRITKPFYLGLGEVTQGEYQRVMGSNPSKFQDDVTRPVERVDWDQASTFCRKLGELPQEQTVRAAYRLPTEAEWEYACRAGTTTQFSFGQNADALTMCGWWKQNSQGSTQPPGRLRPNAWGLCDMAGNVWEWCQDWWASDYYGTSPVEDPSGPAAGSRRVVRGGSWSDDAPACRASFRYGRVPSDRNNFRGFRVVRIVSSSSSR